MAILVFTVTLASSALDAKLQKSSVVEMQNILKVKKEQRDSLLHKAQRRASDESFKNLEEMRQRKESDEQSTLMEMKAAEGAVTAVKMNVEEGAVTAVKTKVEMEQMEEKVQSSKVMAGDSSEEEGEDAEYKRYLIGQGLEGAELEEEWMAWRVANPTKFIDGGKAKVMEAKPKSKLQRFGDRPIKRLADPVGVIKPKVKARGSVALAGKGKGKGKGQGLNTVFRMIFTICK